MDNLINKNSFYISGLLGSKVKNFKKRVNRIVVNFNIVCTESTDFLFNKNMHFYAIMYLSKEKKL